MIFYPLNTPIKAGIKDILIIVTPEHKATYEKLFGNGESFGVHITYAEQPQARGLAEAFIIGESFIGADDVTLILGDNLYQDDFTEAIKSFTRGARVFAKKVTDPERFGVVAFDTAMNVTSIIEKPKIPQSPYAVTGLYIYDARVVMFAKELVPSNRGEIEIVDLHNRYLKLGELEVAIFEGAWIDAGTFDSLLLANILAKESLHKDLII